MKTDLSSDLLTLHAPRDFRGDAATAFLAEAEASLTPQLRALEIDLAETAVLDGSGIGVLLELHRHAAARAPHVSLRLLDPMPDIRHLLELARLHHLFVVLGSHAPFDHTS